MKTILYSVFILLLAPCNSSKKVSSIPVNDHSGVVITYQTTACFGKCPTYTFTVNGKTKTATFKGEQNTEKIGTYTKAVTDNELTQLVTAFETAKFNSLNDDYLGDITDFPIKYITYTDKGKTKTIKERSGAPEALISLEKILRDFAETAENEGWKKSKMADH